jgi:prepilin-type N-terminal cleavage/methylation domain-containing protein
MTTSTPRTEPRARRARAAGFTLVEVMISAALSSFLLAAVLSSNLFIGRTSANLGNYITMESQARRGLETFAEDVRMSKNITWNDTVHVTNGSGGNSITLTIPGVLATDPDTLVTYYYETNSGNAAYRSFCRKTGDKDSTATPMQLITNCTSFSFDRYKTGTLGAASNDLETKQLQLTLTASRSTTTVVTATNLVISARFIMRNKVSST